MIFHPHARAQSFENFMTRMTHPIQSQVDVNMKIGCIKGRCILSTLTLIGWGCRVAGLWGFEIDPRCKMGPSGKGVGRNYVTDAGDL